MTVKIIHLLCVMGWMTGVFAVPRALIYWKRDFERTGEDGPLGDLTFRIYRFSAGLGVLAVATGLWLGWGLGFPSWSLLKIGLVGLLIGHYAWTGALVSQARRGIFQHSDMWLRVFNEASVIGVIAILWIVVAKPF